MPTKNFHILDKAFETYVRNLVGPPQYDRLDARDKKKMMSDFELGVKPRFQYGRRNERLAIDLRGVRDDVDKGIEDETIVLNLYAIPPSPSPKS